MLANRLKYFLVLVAILIISCAKRGSIDGGLKDTLAPILKMSFPKNKNINFKGNEIKLVFDEYVLIKGLDKQLIISPPMKRLPEVLPTTASKTITIKIKDTLQENTTYSMNFGQSIEDNNEANAYKQFKYVFSTGNYLDSLAIGGSIKDAYSIKTDNFVSIMLYEVNNKFTDSIIYKQNPQYITNTLDSLKSFRIENIKAGKYLLIALKDKNKNNKYESREDKIGFQQKFITIPNDTVFRLELFKEPLPLKIYKPMQSTYNKFVVPFEGDANDAKIILTNKQEILPTIVSKIDKKDSLQVFFKPIKTDSLKLTFSKNKYSTNFFLKIKPQKQDTLKFYPLSANILNYREQYKIFSSNPISKIDNSKIQIINKDSIVVKFTTKNDIYNQNIIFDFEKEQLQNYKIRLLPGAFIDYLDQKNDTLHYKFSTKNNTDYGNLTINLEKINRFPVLIELTDNNGAIKESAYSEKKTTIVFNLIDPAKYTIRAIYDDNKNKQFDAGNYLEKRQSEEVIYFPKTIDVRANWDVIQPFDLSK